MIMENDEPTFEIGDRVRHVDGKSVGTITSFPWYPFATVRADNTGVEFTENFHYLVKVRAEYQQDSHGAYVLLVDGADYGLFGEETNAQTAAEWWTRYLDAGGHPITAEEDRLCRRDTLVEGGITLREHLGGPGRTPDLWEVFRGIKRVGRYRTERGALRRVEQLKNS